MSEKTTLHPSLLLAEDLDPALIWELNHPEQQRTGSLNDAWTDLEHYLRDPNTIEVDEILQQFYNHQHSPSVSDPYAAKPPLLYMPLFERRAHKKTYPAPMISTLYRELGAFSFELAQQLQKAHGVGPCYELIIFATGARRQIAPDLIFPSSIREEKYSNRHPCFNHDGYRIRNCRKLPVQSKGRGGGTRRGYDTSVITVLKMRKIIREATNVAPSLFRGIDVANEPAPVVLRTTEIIAKDATKKELTIKERRFLKFLFKIIWQKIEAPLPPKAA